MGLFSPLTIYLGPYSAMTIVCLIHTITLTYTENSPGITSVMFHPPEDSMESQKKCGLWYPIFSASLGGRSYYYPHFTDEETEV